MKAADLFRIPNEFIFQSFFSPEELPWHWVRQIENSFKSSVFAPNYDSYPPLPPGVVVDGPVYIDPSVTLSSNIVITGPAYIGARTEIRPGAYIRGNVIVGEDCVLGNSSEFKNCLLLNRVQAPHFNYVGDSVLGNKVHLAAGVICSNLRLDQHNIPLKLPTGIVDSGLRKLGALIGDEAEVGCNSVLNPGTVIGKRALVYPSMSFGGFLEADTIAAPKEQVIRKVRRR